MKNYKTITSYLLVAFCTFIASCNSDKKVPLEFKYQVVKIDGCEYLQHIGAMGYLHVTHKGNCNNIIHNNTTK